MPHRTRQPRARRRLIAARACAATASALLLLTGTPVSAAPTAADARIVDDEAFITNGLVEVASRENGSFGSSQAAPPGYHPRHPSNLLGFRADRDKDGWGVGTDDGDFFTPGSPFEGWGIQVGDGGTARWNSNSGTAIVGANGDEEAAAGAAQVTWTSTAPVDGVSVTQVSRVPADALRLDVNVTLTNTTGGALTNVYYVRSVDPDNCATVPDPVCDTDGDGDGEAPMSFMTHNKIVSQLADGAPASVVSASQTDGSYIDLRTDAANSVVALPTAGFCSQPSGVQGLFADPPQIGACTFTVTTGDENFTDNLVYLAVRIPSLAAGASRTFRFQYVLAASAAEATPQTITFPEPGAPRADGTIVLAATSSSGLPITYATRSPDVCTVADAVVTPVRTGTCTIAANQGGDGT